MNKTIITGTIFKNSKRFTDAEDSKRSFITFTVSTQKRFKSKTSNKYEYDYIPCVAYGSTAVFINKFFNEGSAIELDGSIINNNYEKDGVKHYKLAVLVNNVEFAPKDFATNEVVQPQFNKEADIPVSQEAVARADEEVANYYKVDIAEIPDFME